MAAWGKGRWGLDGWGGVGTDSGLALVATPAAGSTITDVTPIVLDVTSRAVLQFLITVEYPNIAVVEVVYDSTGLAPLFRNPPSSVVDLGGGATRFIIRRTPRWPDIQVRLHVYAIGLGATLINQVLTWTVTPTARTVAVPAAAAAATRIERFGFGLALPFRFGPANDFIRVSGPELVNTSVEQVLGTRQGEVRWRPGFGASLDTLRHRGNTRALDELARIQVERALGRWVPQIRVLGVVADPISDSTANQMLISTAYQLGNSQPEAAQTVV
jgi:phage baseplate assembly protein W